MHNHLIGFIDIHHNDSESALLDFFHTEEQQGLNLMTKCLVKVMKYAHKKLENKEVII